MAPLARSPRAPPARGGRGDRQAPRPGRRRRQGRRHDRRSRPRDCPTATASVTFQILTDKDREALDVLRHSSAHVMARAVMRLFPGVQLAFGPTIENGFYYDIDSPTADPRGGLPAHRGGDAQDRRRGRAVRALRAADRRGPRPRAATSSQTLQGRAHRRRAEAVPDR